LKINTINFYENNNKSNSLANYNNNELTFFSATKNNESPSEIKPMQNISDTEIERKNYIAETPHKTYTVKSGDTANSIARKHNISVNYLLSYNKMSKNEILSPGKTILKIPSARKAKNINSINDVAKAIGVSGDFIKNLKRIEDGKKDNGHYYSENEFHNSPYMDSEGNMTIGIGHVIKKGDKRYLTNKQVLETFANDLLAVEENLWSILGGKRNYEKLPQPIKEALLDMTFNKGTAILENSEGLVWCLKNEKYEAAINKMTNIKSLKGNEMSGLAKRRLFDIATACKMYNGNIPNTNLATAQNLYKKGVDLLRAEYGNEFKNQIVGYNNYIKQIWGNKIKLITN